MDKKKPNPFKRVYQKVEEQIDCQIKRVESGFEQRIIAGRNLRRLFFWLFLLSVALTITLASIYFAGAWRSEYVFALIAITAGFDSAFFIAWINEVSKERERRKNEFTEREIQRLKELLNQLDKPTPTK